MAIKDLFKYKKSAYAVQTAIATTHPLSGWLGYTTLEAPDYALYKTMRESVPIIDAALDKIVRLTSGFRVECSTLEHQEMMDEFVDNVRVGPCSCGLHQFINAYLDSLLTYGNAVGEIVLDGLEGEIVALYNAPLSNVRVKQGDSPLAVEICSSCDGINFSPVKYPQLVLFTPLSPPAGEIRGTPLLRSLPFVTSILLKIFSSVGNNFDRVANLRYAVTYKPSGSGVDRAYAKDIANNIAQEWSSAMNSAKSGVIKDFVAVGDVDIKVIGADNQMIDTELPVRQLLEQIVAKLGIPPFMLGLHWSSTERMSTQQADILTSELESYRKLLNSVITKICSTFLKLQGATSTVKVVWEDINLQDEVESANARYINAQANELELKLKQEEELTLNYQS